MTPKKTGQENPDAPARDRDPDMAGAGAAMAARRRAVESGADAIPVFEDGEIVWMEVDKESLALRRPRGNAQGGGERA